MDSDQSPADNTVFRYDSVSDFSVSGDHLGNNSTDYDHRGHQPARPPPSNPLRPANQPRPSSMSETAGEAQLSIEKTGWGHGCDDGHTAGAISIIILVSIQPYSPTAMGSTAMTPSPPTSEPAEAGLMARAAWHHEQEGCRANDAGNWLVKEYSLRAIPRICPLLR
jgi:hypothetical protein